MRAVRMAIFTAVASAMLPQFAAQAGTLQTLYSFTGGADGASPNQLVYQGGMLYGTTYTGGAGCEDSGCGTLFAVNAVTGTKTILHQFGRQSGTNPAGPLLYDGGSLIGAAYAGGRGGTGCKRGCGTVFRIDATTGAATTLYNFLGGAAGSRPQGGLTKIGGDLYGATEFGGPANEGTLFKLARKTFAESKLYEFKRFPNPALPNGGIIYRDQNLAGTTVLGGDDNYGALYEFNIAAGTATTLHSFHGHHRDGGLPLPGLAYHHAYIYGASLVGGHSGVGAVFRCDTATQGEKVLYSFTNGADGGTPSSGIIYQSGALYGTTAAGGAAGYGTIFEVDAKSGAETVLYSFQGGTDGAAPTSLIYQAGVFYGTTSAAGAGYGTIFQFTP